MFSRIIENLGDVRASVDGGIQDQASFIKKLAVYIKLKAER
jgi:hypothetical protein